MRSKHVTKVLMNPPYERKYGCMTIVKNVLGNVPAHTACAFILPDKKLEKTSTRQMESILANHRLRKIIKLPENLFNAGVTTSIFVFETGVAQDGHPIFACRMEDDGLVTVKNEGRHDVHDAWPAIEAYWLDVIEKQSGDDSVQWINPAEHLSWQAPVKPFELKQSDLTKTAMDYLLFECGIDAKALKERIGLATLYGMDAEDGQEATA